MADPSETTQASRAPSSVEASELLGAVRALSDQVGGLQAELHSLRAAARQLPPGEADVPGWETDTPIRRDGGATWMRSIASPTSRGPAVPRLLLEIVFLVAVACLAAVARLDTALVIALMAGAWLLVALAEWAADRAILMRNEAAFGRYGGPGDERRWYTPPAQRSLESDIEEHTSAPLPPPTTSG